MSAHSLGPSSLASPAAQNAPGHDSGSEDGSHNYESSSTTTTSQSEAESRHRRDQLQQQRRLHGESVGSSFASSHYQDVYGDTSTSGSRTPTGAGAGPAVENYFSEQPSGRNLLHVLPPGVSGQSSGAGGASGEYASPALGTYTERPSGRGLVHDQSSSDLDAGAGGAGAGAGFAGGYAGRGRGAAGTEVSSPSQQSEGSSAWNDTDAQSHVHGDVRGGGGGGGAVREVELYEEDLAVSEGTESNYDYGSEMTYGHDTAAGGSSVRSFALGGGEHQQQQQQQHALRPSASAAATGPRDVDQQRQRHEALAQAYASSGGASSVASRVVPGRSSEFGTHPGPAIPPGDSWRNSPVPGPGGRVSEIDRILSGETTDSSVMGPPGAGAARAGGPLGSSPGGQEDGDFGAVWLASRAHARQYDASEDRRYDGGEEDTR